MEQKYGHISKEPDGYKVEFNRQLPYSAATVWDAITNPKKMEAWFMETEMDFREGGKMMMRFPDGTETHGTITRILPQKLFEYLWENEDAPSELARWEIFEDGPVACRLALTYSKVAGPWAKSVPAGWHMMLDDLEEVLAGRKAIHIDNNPESETAGDKEIKAWYANAWDEKFGGFTLSNHYGTFHKTGNTYDIRFERILNHPVEKVWDALTNPAKLEQWLGAAAEMELKVGGKVKLGLLMTTVEGKISTLKENQLLEYTWGEENTVRWELFKEGENKCRLVFTETLVSGDALIAAAPGWHGYLDRLAYVINGEEVPHFQLDKWTEIAGDATQKYTAMIEAQKPVAKTQLMIRKPAAEVFEAMVNPEITSKFWYTKSSGRMEEGKTLHWHWEMYNVGTEAKVKEIEKDRKIIFTWGDPGQPGTLVEMNFTTIGKNYTFVTISESGFADDENLISTLVDRTGGWTFLVATLKAYLEHGIILNTVLDHAPEAWVTDRF